MAVHVKARNHENSKLNLQQHRGFELISGNSTIRLTVYLGPTRLDSAVREANLPNLQSYWACQVGLSSQSIEAAQNFKLVMSIEFETSEKRQLNHITLSEASVTGSKHLRSSAVVS